MALSVSRYESNGGCCRLGWYSWLFVYSQTQWQKNKRTYTNIKNNNKSSRGQKGQNGRPIYDSAPIINYIVKDIKTNSDVHNNDIKTQKRR